MVLGDLDDLTEVTMDAWRFTRRTYALAAESLMMLIIVGQLFVGYYSRNPIVLGLHMGESVGQVIFVIKRVAAYIAALA